MSSAGLRLVAGRIPSERIATTTSTSDSGTWTTTETVTETVTAPLVTGRLYRIRWSGGIVTTVGTDLVLIRIREDNLTGTLITERNFYLATTSSGGHGTELEGTFTAVATGDKSFVITGVRNAGTGTHHADGTATRPRYLYVDYISG